MEYARVTQVINAPVNVVWDAISAFGDIKEWTPVVETCVLEGEGVGAVRIVTAMGAVFRERLVSLDATARQLVYRIEDPNILPVTGAECTMSLHALEPTIIEVEWIGRAEGADLPIAQVSALIELMYTQSLQKLKTLLEA